MTLSQRAFQRPYLLVLLAGALAVSLSMGIRQTFGLFMTPMTEALDFGRESFALAIAVQNLLWGAAQPFCGMVADRYGAGRVLTTGAVVYGAGLVVMSGAEGIFAVQIGGGLLIGLAMAATGFSVVLGAVGRLVPEEKRSMAFGLVSAGGSFGQFVMAPVGQALITDQGWSGALVIMAVLALAISLAALALMGRPGDPSAGGLPGQTITQALGEAGRHNGYRLLTTGFFVCGFQVVFVGTHLPSYIGDLGLTPEVGATALALIGFFNIIGSYSCGVLGGKYSKKRILAGLYFLRTLAIGLFLIAPKTELTVLLFASVIGLLWLGTVPLTSGMVAQIFGPRYVSTLFGFVFLSHQVGSFLGAWLGGYLYETTGSYDVVWILAALLGIVAGLLHLPINERSVRLAT